MLGNFRVSKRGQVQNLSFKNPYDLHKNKRVWFCHKASHYTEFSKRDWKPISLYRQISTTLFFLIQDIYCTNYKELITKYLTATTVKGKKKREKYFILTIIYKEHFQIKYITAKNSRAIVESGLFYK